MSPASNACPAAAAEQDEPAAEQDEPAVVVTPATLEGLLFNIGSTMDSLVARIRQVNQVPVTGAAGEKEGEEGRQPNSTFSTLATRDTGPPSTNTMSAIPSSRSATAALATITHPTTDAAITAPPFQPQNTEAQTPSGRLELMKQTVDALGWDGGSYFKPRKDPDKVRAERERQREKWEMEKRSKREEEEERADGRSGMVGRKKRRCLDDIL